MKTLSLLAFCYLTLITLHAIGQSDEDNLDKYWKFRTSFWEKYVKIGSQAGESLPIGKRRPCTCIDNINYNGTCYGELKWGDGTIRHGHYLGFLATEYALLKNNNLDFTGTLNELYYAINALKRLDRDAEQNLEDIYGLFGFYGPNENGFYLREDVPEDFALNFNSGNWDMGCTNSANYHNNNAAKINDPISQYGFEVKTDNYQNVPSLDQMTSLLIGLAVCHKLVDNIYVKPTSLDQGFFIKDEIESIIDRMVTYVSLRNWFILDINGWPVMNDGGNLMLGGYPILKFAESITGNEYSKVFSRKILPHYLKIQHCLTGFGVANNNASEAQQACNDINYCYMVYPNSMAILTQGVPAGVNNNQNVSKFLEWESSLVGLALNRVEGDIDFSPEYWENTIPSQYPAIYADWEDNAIFDDAPFPLNQFKFENLNLTPNNNTIMFNLGVLLGGWNNYQVFNWSQIGGNHELELINAILRDEMPYKEKDFYQDFLNSMPSSGSFFLKGSDHANGYYDSLYTDGGWAGEYRWTDLNNSLGYEIGSTNMGIHSGLDYMYFHNLYRLLFKNEISESFEKTYKCTCVPSIQKPHNSSTSLAANDDLNMRLSYIETCNNVFNEVNNQVYGSFYISPFFTYYTDLDIKPTKYQTEDAWINDECVTHVLTDFVVCNQKTLTINNGGELSLESGNTIVNTNSVIDVSGTLRIGAGNKLDFNLTTGKIILRSSGKIIIEDNGILNINYGGILEYYDGGQIIMEGSESKIILNGSIKMMDGGVFMPDHSASSESGKFVIGSSNAAFITDQGVSNYSMVILEGKDELDPFLYLEPNAKLSITNVDNTNIDKLIIRDSKVEFSSNSKIECYQNIYLHDVTFISSTENQGIQFSDQNLIVNCSFENVPIFADLFLENSDILNIYNSEFSSTTSINQSSLVNINGMGLNISNSSFYGSQYACISSSNLLLPSNITNSNFTSLGSNNTLVGLSDASITEILIKNSTFNYLYAGIQKYFGQLSVKCSSFDNSGYSHIIAGDGCHVNISNENLAGYNYFLGNNSGHIYLSDASIDLYNGRNYFSNTPSYYITGILNYPCGVSTDCSINASHNQWNNNSSPPSQSEFLIFGSDDLQFQVSANQTESIPICGFYDNGQNNPGGGNNSNSLNLAEANSVNSEAKNNGNSPNLPDVALHNGQTKKLDQALKRAIKNMEYFDSTGNNIEALLFFNDLFHSKIEKNSTNKPFLKRALKGMKTTLEHELNFSHLSSQNILYDTLISDYLFALNSMSDSIVDQSNYKEQFYLELDKVQLFRFLKKPILALELISELEKCGIDSTEQVIINKWKKELMIDISVSQIGFNVMDSTFFIDTSSFITPGQSNYSTYNFGSKIIDLNTIIYKPCIGTKSLSTLQNKIKSFNLYPNPAEHSVICNFNNSTSVGDLINICTSQGVNVMTIELTQENIRNGITINIEGLSSGIYFAYLRSNIASAQKLIIK